jgi:radical SAM protein with 4Fe4S-binding SPASM domain
MTNVKINPSFNKNRVVLGEQLPLDTPLSINISASERCNFKCNYCFRSTEPSNLWAYTRSGDLMTMDIFELIAKQLTGFPSQIKRIALSGHGEPLCNPLLPLMVKRLKELGLTAKIDIHTNASLLTPELSAELSESHVDKIIVSLQGLNAQAYKKICGVKIDFDKFYKNLKILYEQKTEKTTVHIKVVDTALSSISEEYEFHKLFSPIADHIFVEKVVPLWKALKFEQNDDSNKYGRSFGYINYCPLVFYTLMITPCGDIYPCLELPPPFSLGNVNKTTLIEAWRSPARVSFLKQHLQNGRSEHPVCEECFIPQNTIQVKEDIIDPYRDAILERMNTDG